MENFKIRKIRNQDDYKLYNFLTNEIVVIGLKKSLRKILKDLKNPKKLGGSVDSGILHDVIKNTYDPDSKDDVEEYQLDQELSNEYGKVYNNPFTNHTIISHRGTQGISDWKNNAMYMTGLYNYTDRNKYGKELQNKTSDKYGNENLSTVGHSQGAILARNHGKDSFETINVNPANGFFPNSSNVNEYTVRSSGDLVSSPKTYSDTIKSVLFPKWSKSHNKTIKAKSFNPLAEHSSDVLNRMDPKTKIGRKNKK
jgi:hypothetical protein